MLKNLILYVFLSRRDTKHNHTQQIIMLSTIMLSVGMLNVVINLVIIIIMLSTIMLIVNNDQIYNEHTNAKHYGIMASEILFDIKKL